ncbi:MAG: YitT family protein [Clostridium sp.]|nr:YitT family protein [Clostridium sp.]MCI7443846.1 YitT family protein [Clostridium sp.]
MKKFKEYILITIGFLLTAIAFEYFFFSNSIASGGVSGFALIMKEVFNIEPGIVMILCNIVLFILAFIFLGGSFGVKSAYAAFGLSISMSIIEKFTTPVAITDNLILATIFGSVIIALGAVIIFNQGASTGGTSIIAKLLSEYFNINIGVALLIVDSLIIILATFTFGIELGLFGLIGVYLSSTLIDKFIDGFSECKQVFIFTQKEELVSKYIIKDVDRGCTIFKGKGGYTKKENVVILTVLDRKQFIKLKKFMKTEDPTAFITVNEVSEVLGQGFRTLV